ncbi:MAG: hypothetical protein JKY95_07935 [Planctomycetaceae bacterium]|nr:hypothetical protein [Planctomycetaceae bacterium]
MNRLVISSFRFVHFVLIIGCLTITSNVQAQGLLWNLPESGTWVRYAGEYRQETLRPQSEEGDLTLQWQRELEIRCLERTQAVYQGKEQTCVWLEFEIVTGQQVDGQLEAGPGSKREYKILVPESVVIGEKTLSAKIPQGFIPIVEGYRKIGNGKVEPMQAKVFQVFPVISQVLINEDAKVAAQEDVSVPTGAHQTDRIECTSAIEDASSRTGNVTQLWVSKNAPFGPVKWSVRIDRETKNAVDKRDQFKKHAEITVQMEAVQTGNDAVSKVVVPN